MEQLYPTVTEKVTNELEAESNRYLSSINFTNLADDFGTLNLGGETSNSRKVRFDLHNSSKAITFSKLNEEHKDNPDDLFAESSPPPKRKDSHDDDLFADDSPKKSDHSDDLFESKSEHLVFAKRGILFAHLLLRPQGREEDQGGEHLR